MHNVMCLYVQMCMSVLRIFIILSVVMVGCLCVCLRLVCCSVFQFTSQDMLFTALLLAWYWLPAEEFKHENAHATIDISQIVSGMPVFEKVKHSACTKSIQTALHKGTGVERPSPTFYWGIWMNLKQSDLFPAQACCTSRWNTFHRSGQNKTYSLSF